MKNTSLEEELKKKFEKKIVGYNARGIVYYSDGLGHGVYKEPYAVCRNCGAEAKGEKAKSWMLGHKNCPKPNGSFIRNNLTAEKLWQFIEQSLSSQKKQIIKHLEEMDGCVIKGTGKKWLVRDYIRRDETIKYIKRL